MKKFGLRTNFLPSSNPILDAFDQIFLLLFFIISVEILIPGRYAYLVSLLIAPLFEEFYKFFFLRRHGIAMAILATSILAIVECSLYLIAFYFTGRWHPILIVIRVSVMFVHFVFLAIQLLCVKFSFIKNENLRYIVGLLMAILAHASWNAVFTI